MATPESFFCPITTELMKDPVTTADGFSYEREAITQWFATGQSISPSTGALLDHQHLVPNHALRNAIQEFTANSSAAKELRQSGPVVQSSDIPAGLPVDNGCGSASSNDGGGVAAALAAYPNNGNDPIPMGLPVSTTPPPPVASFSHYGSAWEAYPREVAMQIAAAMAAQPAGGRLALSGGPFELRWGNAATSSRMSRPPDTRMIQVNTTSGNTRIVRKDPQPTTIDVSDLSAAVPAVPSVPSVASVASVPAVPVGIPPGGGGRHPAAVASNPTSQPSTAPHANPNPTSKPTTPLQPLHQIRFANGATLIVAAGSVLDFVGDAFVNAANEGCVGGFGVDELVNQKGGPRLVQARQALRGCPTGYAKATPSFDHTLTRWILHAVGPVYRINKLQMGFDEHDPRAKALMSSLDCKLVGAYRAALGEGARTGCRTIGSCLLSAGVFRGARPLGAVIELAVRTLAHALATDPKTPFQSLTLVGYTQDEQRLLLETCRLVDAEIQIGGNGGGRDPLELFVAPFDVTGAPSATSGAPSTTSAAGLVPIPTPSGAARRVPVMSGLPNVSRR